MIRTKKDCLYLGAIAVLWADLIARYVGTADSWVDVGFAVFAFILASSGAGLLLAYAFRVLEKPVRRTLRRLKRA